MPKSFPSIFILIVNWNGKKDTLECLASVQKINYPNFQILLIDNGSTDDSILKIKEAYPHLLVLENGSNLGFAEGNNRGIEWALRHKAEWIFLLNNDTIVDPEILNSFLEASKQEPQGKIFGAKILRYHQPEIIDHLGGFWNPHLGEFISADAGEKDHPFLNMRSVDYVCGAALFMHRFVPEKIGLLEPNFFLFWEESDYCWRAKKVGFEIWTAPKAKLWHKGSSSFSGGKPHMHYFWWRSRLLWIERNCSLQEKKRLYRTIIRSELWKMTRHYLIKSLINWIHPKPIHKEKILRLKAGCRGAFDFFRRRFGNCPIWLLKK